MKNTTGPVLSAQSMEAISIVVPPPRPPFFLSFEFIPLSINRIEGAYRREKASKPSPLFAF